MYGYGYGYTPYASPGQPGMYMTPDDQLMEQLLRQMQPPQPQSQTPTPGLDAMQFGAMGAAPGALQSGGLLAKDLLSSGLGAGGVEPLAELAALNSGSDAMAAALGESGGFMSDAMSTFQGPMGALGTALQVATTDWSDPGAIAGTATGLVGRGLGGAAGTAAGAKIGGIMGSVAGPVGAAVGATAGKVIGDKIFGAGKESKKEKERRKRREMMEALNQLGAGAVKTSAGLGQQATALAQYLQDRNRGYVRTAMGGY